MAEFKCLIVEPREGWQVIRLNRPEALNALNTALMAELTAALDAAEADPEVRCVVLTGSEKAFAAGADIREMAALDYPETYLADFITRTHERAARFRKPLIAAVSGYALGGGCELAMMCDIVIAADTAKFGQPEVTLGIGPGMGGSQRLTRAVGKAKAMDMVLTGRTIDAAEAERSGQDRVALAGGRDRVQGDGRSRLRDHPRPGAQDRAAAVPGPVRHRGPEGRHGRLP
jgi:enoyl-CoA hydratase/carnithine racemase